MESGRLQAGHLLCILQHYLMRAKSWKKRQLWMVQTFCSRSGTWRLPAIKNIIVIQFILQAGNIMSIGFEKAYALQTDMNLPASEILSTYVYRIGLLNGDYGYSTAV